MTAHAFERATGILRFCRNYRNPLSLACHQWWRSKAVVVAVDRATGVACACRPGARRMFGEVWYDRDYDVPRMPVRPGDTVIDVGANQGFFTCHTAWRGARVVAIEPDPANRALLEANVARNGFAESVRILPCAVSGWRGDADLYATDAMGGGMSTICPGFVSAMNVPVRERLRGRTLTLEDVFRECELGHVRLCKLDCEGAELDIVRSLPASLRARVDAFVLEYHGSYALRAWETHAISFAEPKSYCERNILRAVRREILLEPEH